MKYSEKRGREKRKQVGDNKRTNRNDSSELESCR